MLEFAVLFDESAHFAAQFLEQFLLLAAFRPCLLAPIKYFSDPCFLYFGGLVQICSQLVHPRLKPA